MDVSGENRDGAGDGSVQDEYRWRCPICDDTSGELSSEWGKNALRGLKVHVYFAEGEGHGDARSYPSGLPESELRQFVLPTPDPVDADGR